MIRLTVRLPARDRTRTCVRSGVRATRVLFGALALLGWASAACAAEGPALFRDADLRLGEKLIAEHQCAACHARRVGGDGSAIYRPTGRINSPAALQAMVEMCNTELKLQLFPEEVLAMAAVLQRDHYRFGAAPRR